MALFLSDEWINAAKEAINSWPPEAYKEEKLFLYWMWMDMAKPHVTTTWALGVHDMPPDGASAFAAFELKEGTVIDAGVVTEKEARKAPFLLHGPYENWKAMMEGYDVGKSIMYRKLMLEGDVHAFFRTIYFYSESLIAMQRLGTSFPEGRAA